MYGPACKNSLDKLMSFCQEVPYSTCWLLSAFTWALAWCFIKENYYYRHESVSWSHLAPEHLGKYTHSGSLCLSHILGKCMAHLDPVI